VHNAGEDESLHVIRCPSPFPFRAYPRGRFSDGPFARDTLRLWRVTSAIPPGRLDSQQSNTRGGESAMNENASNLDVSPGTRFLWSTSPPCSSGEVVHEVSRLVIGPRVPSARSRIRDNREIPAAGCRPGIKERDDDPYGNSTCQREQDRFARLDSIFNSPGAGLESSSRSVKKGRTSRFENMAPGTIRQAPRALRLL